MIPLIVGTTLALIALSFVLYPLLAGGPRSGESRERRMDEHSASARDPAHGMAVDALREIEFDRATGKLSDADYASLKASYTQEAIATMREGGPPVCVRCGPRPERGARFCSSCGMPIPA